MGRVVNAEELSCRKGAEFGPQVPNEKSRQSLAFEEMFGFLGFSIGKVVPMTVREPNVDDVIFGFRSEVNVFGIATQ